jgi:hypothetical protein
MIEERQNYDLGIDVERLVKVTSRLDAAGYDVAGAAEYWRGALERVSALAGVESAALVSYAPFAGSYGRTVRLQRDGRQQLVYVNNTSSGYFETMGIPMLRGRTYTAQEIDEGAQVAVVSEGLARALWEGEDALGATLARLADDLAETRIVGIAADAPLRLEDLEAGMLYRPVVRGDGYGSMLRVELLVRARGAAGTVLQPVHEALRALDPDALPHATALRDEVDERLLVPRMYASLAAMLGAIALALACTGIFALTAFSVEQRAGEIGVRMAIGARTGDVVRLMLRDSLRPVLAGLLVGLVVGLAGARVLTAVLYGVSPHDPMALLGAVSVLLAAALLAAGMAARRATRVDPVAVLGRN